MRTIIVAPHPDDEILGAGGTLLRRKAEGCDVAWLIVTGISEGFGWSKEVVGRRDAEIRQVAEAMGFDYTFQLAFPPAGLDAIALSDLIAAISLIFKEYEPNEVFLPHRGDVHTDHRLVHDAVVSCTKWFRYPSVRRILSYETLSETDFGLHLESAFCPNVYVGIEPFLEDKIRAMSIYESELGVPPFPRSIEAIRALATFRGSTSGFSAAEAFMLLKEIE